ncbi:MAG: glycoside hydrolase [Cellvibrionaceae bacterium]|nr:glycoside hydrolase [Cellvibrionaceae bacterium]
MLQPFKSYATNRSHNNQPKQAPILEAQVTLCQQQVIESVRKEYLSFSIDISVLAGGFWWEGSNGSRRGLGRLRVTPIDLSAGKLDRYVRALSPSYLRVGGSEADKIHYFDSDIQSPDTLILTKKIWDDLHHFIKRNQLKFSFTFKYGLFKRSEHGQWQGTEIDRLLQYSKQQGYNIDVCELGNELNAYWAFHGLTSQPGPKKLAQDYGRFSKLVKHYLPDAKIAGPGSAFWPKLGETITPFSNITQKFLQNITTELDIIDWHFYPSQSSRSPIRTRAASQTSMLAPKSLESFATYSNKLKAWRDLYQPNAEIWTGETGSAQCGGQPRISDRYASCFWWADQLGRGAALGQKIMVRQSLIGGDYGMIDRLSLKPRPDFWLSWLWVKLMGQDVFQVHSSQDKVRAYCHRHPDHDGMTLMLINTAECRCKMETKNFAEPFETYTVTARSLSSKKIRINGEKPHFKKGKVSLEDFPQLPATPYLPALSISFWRVHSAAG